MPSLDAEIIAKFGPKANNEDILKKCRAMIELFGLSAEELFLKWESWVVTSSSVDGDAPLTVDNLQQLQESIQRALTKENQKPDHTANTKRPIIRGTPDVSLSSIIPSSPSSVHRKKRKLEAPDSSFGGSSYITAASSSPLKTSSPASSPVVSRTKASGSVLESLNESVVSAKAGDGSKLRLIANFDPTKYKFRTMSQKLLEVAEYLDEQIDSAARTFLAGYGFEESEFGDPSVQGQSEILAVGRIVPDSPDTEFDANLNKESLFLETSRKESIGQRVRLDLSALQDYSLFPGQITCFRGLNQTGASFKVLKQYEFPYLGSAVTSEEDITTYKEQLHGENAKIVVTAGPYTPSKQLSFDMLHDFVNKMNNEVHPNAIVMLGPFLDVNHEQIKSGLLDFSTLGLPKEPKTLDEVFKMVVAPILRQLQCHQVILIPSTKDAMSNHPAYPQEMFDRKSLGLSKNFKCFPDPATFSLNEVLIGCSNVDILKDLRDVNGGKYLAEARFNRVAEHILEQRRYYPSFPGAVKRLGDEFISGADLHVSYFGLTEFSDSLPDVLIIPSELKYFAKVIKNVLVINPGAFVKRNSPGSYAIIAVKSPEAEDMQKVESGYLSSIWTRARVDILKV